ncbi:two-component system response regulator [Noviherbaspirillum autotrophicum]|uniref:Diguanylate cyclase n=1 Tax=Noviherbaspirillum autotrophicum TaxID=709839 RepID=A0A0C2BKU9_9BURK|nr:EAL domain-containing protein [Noviherbaspirillum autotrophicum]KIF80629.1 diguanylate cyclase [Noviherbaspirillum autotrophicum]
MVQTDEIRVLLVNDDPGSRFALHTILTDLDAAIETAASGEEALMLLLKKEFAVIILDVKMTGLDGFETARLIRQRPRTKYTPIIFLTSHRATDLDRATGYELGAVDYLFMPVAPEVLKSKVQVFIDLARTNQRRERSDADLETTNRQLQQQLEQVMRLNETLRAEIVACKQAGEYFPGGRKLMPVANGAAPVEEGAQGREIERLIAQHAGDFVSLLDAAGAWVYASPSYHAAFGKAIREGSYFDIVHADDREPLRDAFRQLVRDGTNARLHYRVLVPERGERHLESEASVIPDAAGKVAQVVMVSRDITDRKEMEAYILHQSFHDTLTGLPNRLLLEDRMRQATANLGRQHAPVAVLFIDLDRFKDINDTLGHASGDRLLQEVAERLGRCVREGDTVARLSGDEFVVLLAGLHDVQDAALVANKIVRTVAEPCLIGGRELRVSPSIGIAIFPDDGQNMEELLRNADTAMYHAKQEGRGRYSFFAARMNEAADQRLAVGSALQRAIQEGEFVLYYQPKISAVDGELRGFEALIRWPQPDGEWMSPGTFIPIAEETGRIEPIGKWALHEAARQIKQWIEAGATCCPIAVNVSARQFHQASLMRDIQTALQRTGIPPGLLEAELTESAVMADPAKTIQALHQIRDLGVSISVDDFGTGYSSLAYLKRFPLDKLKVDAAFVRDIATDPDDAAIVSAIITLAHSLNLTVIAEGVETADQMAFLIEHGCDEMQGHYFSKPVPSEEALEMLKRGRFNLH